jgi:hypothetical protein
MNIVSSGIAILSEEAAAQSGQVSPYVFGAFAFVALTALLVVVMMIKVGD